MKSIISIFVLLCLYSGLTNGQFKQGDWELAMVGSFGSLSHETSYNYSSGNISANYSNSESYTYAIISITPAYYIADGFSIEPELGLFAIETSSPSQFIIGNLSYTYLLPESKIALFARAGYGVSNSLLFTYNEKPFYPMYKDLDIKLVNLGAGLKYLVTSSVIMKTELNYLMQRYSKDTSSGLSSGTTKSNWNRASLLFGFSILI